MEEQGVKELIDIDSFRKIRLRVGKVLSAEAVPKSKKLLRLSVDFGGENRTILSGISQYYKPEELNGKKMIFVFNLKPAKLMGLDSEGMLLCAQDKEGKLSVLTLDRDLQEGSDIS